MRGCFVLSVGLLVGMSVCAAGCSQVNSDGGESADSADRPRAAGSIAWDQLRSGVTPDEVLRLLGKPRDVEVEMVSTFWFYSDGGKDGAFVVFDTRPMTVRRWVRP